MARGLLLAFLGILALSVSSQAATYVVLPDGSGDYPDIQQAIDAAHSGDVILLGYGRFTGPGNRNLSYRGKALTIRSQSGHPETCIIDPEGSHTNLSRAIHFDGEGPDAKLLHVTIEHGYVDDMNVPFLESCGGAMLFTNGASPTITNVVIRDCGAFAGGGVFIWSGSPHFTDCRFEGNGACGGGGGYAFDGAPEFHGCWFVANTPLQSGGGITISGSESVVFTNCVFLDNTLDVGLGGALDLRRTVATVTGCTFAGNRTYPGKGGGTRCVEPGGRDRGERDLEGGAICIEDAQVTIANCTIVNNTGLIGGGIGCSEWQETGSQVTVLNTIVAFNDHGGAVTCGHPNDAITLSCCDLYGNVGGDWTGCIAGQFGQARNISEDPLFCDVDGGDLGLGADSPCAPAHSHGCYQIGAWPVGCGDTSAADLASLPGRSGLFISPNPARGSCRIEIRPASAGAAAGRPSVGEAAAPAFDGAAAASVGAGAGELRVQVLDVTGRLVRTLFRGAQITPELTWDGRDDLGRDVGSGIYFVRMDGGGQSVRGTLVLAR